ncbi:hypothetical protein Bca4012_050314 [Brassica carinata]
MGKSDLYKERAKRSIQQQGENGMKRVRASSWISVTEKTIAARRSQMKTIIFLEGNRINFEELADNVTEGLDVYFVDDYKRIFELAFGYDKQQD